MPQLRANGIDIFFESQGIGDPLVLIPNLMHNHLIWRDVIPALSKQYQVITLDNRGSGRTDKPNLPYTIELIAEDLLALIDALGLKKPNLLAHSMSGLTAIHLAATYPRLLNKLILCDSAAAQPRATLDYLQSQLALIDAQTHREELFKSALPWLYARSYLEEPGRMEFLIHLEKNNPYPQPTYALKRQIEACILYDAHPALPSINIPTLVMCGGDDSLLPPETSKELADSIPGSTLKIIPGAAHMLPVEDPVIFLREITDFLH